MNDCSIFSQIFLKVTADGEALATKAPTAGKYHHRTRVAVVYFPPPSHLCSSPVFFPMSLLSCRRTNAAAEKK